MHVSKKKFYNIYSSNCLDCFLFFPELALNKYAEMLCFIYAKEYNGNCEHVFFDFNLVVIINILVSVRRWLQLNEPAYTLMLF